MSAEMEISKIRVARGNSGHPPRGDPLGQPLDDARLADTRCTDEDGIRLALLRKNSRHAQNLVLPSDDRLQLAAPRQLGDVSPEKTRAPISAAAFFSARPVSALSPANHQVCGGHKPRVHHIAPERTG